MSIARRAAKLAAPGDSPALRPSFRAALQDATRRGYVAAYRWLGDREEARDAVQEAAARAVAAAARYDPSRPFYAWFHRILTNHCRDRRARRSTAQRARPQLVAAPTQAAAEQLLLTEERAAAVASALEGLPPDAREILELRHFQDLDYATIADLLGIAEGTVMSRLFRARRRLRAALAEHPALSSDPSQAAPP